MQNQNLNNNPVFSIISTLLDNSEQILIKSIKILLYKENPNIFELINFEDDTIYCEPFLFAYFVKNTKLEMSLQNIILTYTDVIISNTEMTSDEYGRLYIPNFGWFITESANEILNLNLEKVELKKDNIPIRFIHQKPFYIENTKIELLRYSIPILKPFYKNADNQLINVEIETITNVHLKHITKAYNLIKTHIPTQFKLIERYAPKCVIFNTDTSQRNSFANFGIHGISFYNAYQKEYDEVFFVDDIAHQTGHVILNNLTIDIDSILNKNADTILEIVKLPCGKAVENRSLFVIFHALYTYYTTLTCLDTCLTNKAFFGKQKHEAIGRIAFYIDKFYNDLLLIDSPIDSSEGALKYFTNNGLLLYTEIKMKWFYIYDKWHHVIKDFDMSNQPYNFTYSNFVELNPNKYI